MKKKKIKKSPNISIGDLRRLARRGGVSRVSPSCYSAVELALRSWLRDVIQKAFVYTSYSRRITMSEMDVVYGLKKKGITMYL